MDSLPPELRNIIYRMVLISSQPLVIDRGWTNSTALLRTSKQIHNEAKSIFLENTFRIICATGTGQSGATWLKALGSDVRRVSKIIVDFGVSAHTFNQLRIAHNIILKRARSDDFNADDRDGNWEFFADTMSIPIGLLTADACPVAVALSQAVGSGLLRSEQLHVRTPQIDSFGQPPGFSKAKCVLFMHGLFEGLGEPWSDRMRQTVLQRKDYGKVSAVYRYYEVSA